MLIRENNNSTFTVAGTTKFSEPINSFLPLQKQFRNYINSVFEVNMNLSIHHLYHNLGYHNLNGFYQLNTRIIKYKMPPNPKVLRILDLWNMNAKLVLTTKYSDSCKTTSLLPSHLKVKLILTRSFTNHPLSSYYSSSIFWTWFVFQRFMCWKLIPQCSVQRGSKIFKQWDYERQYTQKWLMPALWEGTGFSETRLFTSRADCYKIGSAFSDLSLCDLSLPHMLLPCDAITMLLHSKRPSAETHASAMLLHF